MEFDTHTLELLRAGPPHNQLLSPLTQYLATFDSAPSEAVSVPFDQYEFDQTIRDLRYQTDAAADSEKRQYVLETTGRKLATMMGKVPDLQASLTRDAREGLFHLRIRLFASELASLPWEITKDPDSASANWLCLQSHAPTVITRHIRGVKPSAATWDKPPKILFIHSDAGGEVPHQQHFQALEQILKPWTFPSNQRQKGKVNEDFITTLGGQQATIDNIAEKCSSNKYSHIHVLAHGGMEPGARYTSYGVTLSNGHGDADIVNGERFATAVCQFSQANSRPAVVTIAACDGGNVGSMIKPGASFAHPLHRAGIPFVVASQFLLSSVGSEIFVQKFLSRPALGRPSTLGLT